MGAWGVDGVQGGAWQCEWIQGDAGGCKGTVCFGVGGEGIQRDAGGCRWMLVAAGGYIIHLLQLICQCVQS